MENNELILLDFGFTRRQTNISSKITTAITDMTSTELKCFYQVATLIKMDDSNFKEYEISADKFMDAIGLNKSNKQFLLDSCKKLMKQSFTIEWEDDSGLVKKRNDFLIINIFDSFRYDSKNDKIYIKFSQSISPYLLKLKNNFTQIKNIEYLKSFNSEYSIKIYALLKDYRKMKQRKINLDWFKTWLGTPKTYDKNFAHLNNKVLEVARAEINEKSDLNITNIERIKTGKKITDIVIHYEFKKDLIARKIIMHLLYLFRKSGKDLNVFKGQFFANTNSVSFKECIRMIDLDSDTRFYYAKDSKNRVIVQSANLTKFVDSLANGIYRATKLKIQESSSHKLKVDEWQEEQIKKDEIIKLSKELVAKWQEESKTLDIYGRSKHEIEQDQLRYRYQDKKFISSNKSYIIKECKLLDDGKIKVLCSQESNKYNLINIVFNDINQLTEEIKKHN